ncbi:MAG: membrane protein insertase YidC [Candidatus Aerophobetes bacterium]|nr:membrane protein insertase YidC [Candidatus Aerophobetes bacterium]
MEKNVILAIVLSIMVLIFFNFFVFSRFPSSQKEEVKPSPSVKKELPLSKVKEEKEEEIPIEMVKEVKLENDQLSIILTSKGGRVKSWYLKNSKKELIREDIPGLGLNLFLPEGERIPLDGKNFQVELKEEEKKVTFSWEDEKKGFKVVKVLRIPQHGYNAFLTIMTENLPRWSEYQITLPGGIEKKWGDEEQLIFYQGSLLKENKQGIRSEYGKGVDWAGIRQKGDLLVILASLSQPSGMIFGPNSWGLKDNKTKSEWVVYAGPQNYSFLRPLNEKIKRLTGRDYRLTKAIDSSGWSGFWKSLSIGLSWIIFKFYDLTHNYGMAIILLTFLIYGLLFPLTFKQFKSMQQMQVIQPELAAIQKKFKNDPKRLQVEMMNLYKKHKVNPMGGCLPMIIQLPIIFILYRAILGFNFSENPSFLWIPDLGKYDIPLLIMVGVTMFLQQRISRKAQPKGQQQQGLAKMMQFFPFFIIIFLWSLPSAVMLYWFVSTLFSLVQQLFITRRMMPSGGIAPKK